MLKVMLFPSFLVDLLSYNEAWPFITFNKMHNNYVNTVAIQKFKNKMYANKKCLNVCLYKRLTIKVQ